MLVLLFQMWQQDLSVHPECFPHLPLAAVAVNGVFEMAFGHAEHDFQVFLFRFGTAEDGTDGKDRERP